MEKFTDYKDVHMIVCVALCNRVRVYIFDYVGLYVISVKKDDVLHLHLRSDVVDWFLPPYMNLCIKNKEQISERFDLLFNVQRTEKLCSMTMKRK